MQLQPSTQSLRVIWVRAGKARSSSRDTDQFVHSCSMRPLTFSRHEHLVEVPGVAELRVPLPEPFREVGTEFLAPVSNTLVGYDHASLTRFLSGHQPAQLRNACRLPFTTAPRNS